MNEYNISDYQIFSNATTTTSDSVRLLVESLNGIKTEAEKLRNPDIFYGPICDSILAEWDSINSKSDELINSFNQVISYLNTTATSYAGTDTKTGGEIGGDTNG